MNEHHVRPDGPRFEEWEAALDALEARLAREEAALTHGAGSSAFGAVVLPSAPMSERDRARAHVALERVRLLEADVRRLLATRPRHASSPYT